MKTFLPLQKNVVKVILTIVISTSAMLTQAQPIPVLSEGLKFENYQHISGTDLGVGSLYRFTDIAPNVDALVSIDSLVNGAKVNRIDDNSNGQGYKAAFQPAIQSGNLIGSSYAVFSIQFVQKETTMPVILQSVNATAIDLDGSNTLKEFVEIVYGTGASMSYWVGTPDIQVTQLINGAFYAKNVLGIERNGIDTSALTNMFTATKNNTSSFTIKYGTATSNATTATRQYSLYMKGFTYPPSTLPVSLTAFSASLINTKVDLKWRTASEINVNYFMVERSSNGVDFTDAGMVFAVGNSTTDMAYTLSDNVANVTSPVVYYRLRSVDNDGKSQLSEVRMVRLAKQGQQNSLSILTFPNPVTNELRITNPASWQNKNITYEIFSLNGQLVSKSIIAGASQIETTNISKLQSGVYMVKASCEGQIATQRIVKH